MTSKTLWNGYYKSYPIELRINFVSFYGSNLKEMKICLTTEEPDSGTQLEGGMVITVIVADTEEVDIREDIPLGDGHIDDGKTPSLWC